MNGCSSVVLKVDIRTDWDGPPVGVRYRAPYGAKIMKNCYTIDSKYPKNISKTVDTDTGAI